MHKRNINSAMKVALDILCNCGIRNATSYVCITSSLWHVVEIVLSDIKGRGEKWKRIN